MGNTPILEPSEVWKSSVLSMSGNVDHTCNIVTPMADALPFQCTKAAILPLRSFVRLRGTSTYL